MSTLRCHCHVNYVEQLFWMLKPKHIVALSFTHISRYLISAIRKDVNVYIDTCVKEVDRFRDGSVLVWGGITFDAKITLFVLRKINNARRYVAILEPEAILFHRRLGNHLMQDKSTSAAQSYAPFRKFLNSAQSGTFTLIL